MRRIVIACLRLCVAGLTAHHAPAFAAEPAERVSTDYTFREWHIADGLPSEQIARVTQDGAGFLWVATTGGVVRFDGSHFEKYPLAADANVAPRGLAWSAQAGLLAAIPAGGLAVFERGAFRPWHAETYQARRIATMFVEPAGALWLVGDDGTVIRHDAGKAQVFGRVSGLPRARQRTFATDGDGRVWIASDGYVARYADGAWLPLAEDFGGAELRLASSTRGGPWVITPDQVRQVEGPRSVQRAALPSRLGAHYVQAALEDRNGTLWIGTRSQGLHLVAGGAPQRVPTSHDDIYALFEDREGNLWTGTNGGGLDRIRRKSYRLHDKSAGLLDNYSYTVCADERGDVGFANRDGGVARLHAGEVERFAGRPGWPTFSAVSVFPRPGGGIGVTTGLGVFLVGDEDASIRRVAAIPQSPVARVTYAAKNGDVWFALDANRVGRLRGETFETYDRERGMDGREVRAITEDSGGNIWLGSTDGKLFRSHESGFERVPLPGVETGGIQTIRIEPDGRTWLGTLGAGLVVLSGGQSATCDIRHGLPENDITQILPDDHGFVWFASKRGLFRLSRPEILGVLEGRLARVSPRLIGPDDGMKDIACSGLYQPGAWKSPDGTLWFATRRGVLALDPTRQLTAPPPPAVAIEEIACDNRPVPLRPSLRIDARMHKLEFRLGVLCLSHPERVRAEYRLDGFDDDWVIAPENHRATYPRLPPGTYRFRVRASFGEHDATETGAALELTVVPRWWQTDWFRLATLLAGALGVTIAARAWSHRRLRQRVEKLERESAIRTRIAQNIHDDLGANLTQISLLTQAARQAPAATGENLERIHATVGEITRSMDEIVWAVNPKFDDAESLAGYLGDFARNFLGAAGVRCRLELPGELPALALASQTRHHLFLCCKEALHNLVKHAGATEARIALAVEGARLTVAISDNGRGLHAAAPDARPADRVATGNGLENMRQRMAEIGGTFTLTAAPGGGTTAIFSVECPHVAP